MNVVAARTVATPEQMRALAVSLAPLLRAGDLLVLDGPLGAGKTVFAQGLAAGLGVTGAVTSPTFVIARVHPPLGAGPGLVHVDAYRLGLAEGEDPRAALEDLDLDSDLATSVVAVEWGAGLVESLAHDRLLVRIVRDPEHETRHVALQGTGERWTGVTLQG